MTLSCKSILHVFHLRKQLFGYCVRCFICYRKNRHLSLQISFYLLVYIRDISELFLFWYPLYYRITLKNLLIRTFICICVLFFHKLIVMVLCLWKSSTKYCNSCSVSLPLIHLRSLFSHLQSPRSIHIPYTLLSTLSYISVETFLLFTSQFHSEDD